ncbi:hypothetical protein C8R42DRAFT_648366 [Lentinula raphanica]|nr:hypothetical protein C8R42DRAFT_648366 [Lentinula raphanica]
MPPTTTYASSSIVHFNVIGPSTVIFFISSIKIILKQLAKYSLVFPDTTSKGSPSDPFPKITLHYLENVASELYLLTVGFDGYIVAEANKDNGLVDIRSNGQP